MFLSRFAAVVDIGHSSFVILSLIVFFAAGTIPGY
jgi:hypothetical protein